MIKNLFFLLASLSLTLACGGPKNTGKVVGYEPGKVLTKKSSYQVGELPSGWQRDEVGKFKALVLYNPQLKSSIESGSFCEESFSDAPLSSLTNHLHIGIKDKKTLSQKELLLDGRGALRTLIEGKVDGVPIWLDSVVLKKDACLFDFVLISAPEHYKKAEADFEKFFGEFHFEGSTP